MTYSPTERDGNGYPERCHPICPECETVAHCSAHGCIPETVYAPLRVTLEGPEPLSDVAKALWIVFIGIALGCVAGAVLFGLMP